MQHASASFIKKMFFKRTAVYFSLYADEILREGHFKEKKR
jgi:hypothetical protein